jgi:hypothetical protein
MVVTSVASFERFFRAAADLDVDKTDLKRFQAFVREKIADLLTIAQARARVDDRDVIESRDLPITKGLQESIHRFRRLDLGAEVRPMLEEIATSRPRRSTRRRSSSRTRFWNGRRPRRKARPRRVADRDLA